MKHPNWNPATIPDPAVERGEADRIERERGCQPIELTDEERAELRAATNDAFRSGTGAFSAGFTPGLVVRRLTVDDLTDSEKAAFGFGGDA